MISYNRIRNISMEFLLLWFLSGVPKKSADDILVLPWNLKNCENINMLIMKNKKSEKNNTKSYLFKLASLSNLFAASSPKNWSELIAFAPPNFFTAVSPSSVCLLILVLPLPPNEFELPKKYNKKYWVQNTNDIFKIFSIHTPEKFMYWRH